MAQEGAHHRGPGAEEAMPGTAVAEAGDRRKLMMAAGISICLVFFVIAIIVIVLKLHQESSGKKEDGSKEDGFCTKAECEQYGYFLSSSLDSSVDPCDDFYGFVCSGWDKGHEKSVFYEHRRNHLVGIAETAETANVPETGQNAVQKAAKYYQTCIEIAMGKRSETQQFIQMLRAGNVTWPLEAGTKDLLAVMAYAQIHWDSAPILEFSKSLLPNGTIVVNITQGSFTFVWEDIRQDLIAKGKYDDYFKKSYELLQRPVPDDKVFNETLGYENQIMDILLPSMEFEEIELVSDEEFKNYPNILEYARWRRLFNDVLGIPEQASIAISLDTLPYFQAVNNATLKLSEVTIEQFLEWGIIFEIGHLFMPGMAELMYESHEKAADTARYRCLLHVETYMGTALVTPYLSSILVQDVLKQVKTLFKSVVEVIRTELQFDYEKHMEQQNYTEIFDGYDHVKPTSELDKKYSSYPDMDKLFTNNLLNVIAAWRKNPDGEIPFLQEWNYYNIYDDNTGRFIVLPFVNKAPIYSAVLPKNIQLAALGSLMLSGVMKDLLLNAVQELSEPNRKKLTDAQRCVESEVQPSFEKDFRVYESIAMQYLKAAYDSIGAKDSEGLAKDMSKYSKLQQMLISMCYIRCTGSGETRKDACNLPMQNLKEFASAFKCSASSKMNPSKKCSVV
ncbi:endothelin-converting enzyme 1-like [Ornithodoros turicata]|uniref:endothelin-converting enzyme 1-like n=1 Tax=Ornithodoros turicata TaxID=34597 RepID=UPI0031394E50